MKLALVLLFGTASLFAASDWFARVEPVMSSAEKKLYRSLREAEKPAFEQGFWAGKRITQEDYMQRVAYIDETFGSGKTGSGANTDCGRVYLTLGKPNKITRLASSRTFFPLEIWYYSEAPSLNLHYELQLLFYQRNGTGEYRLYSPTLNTIRDLMNPQAATRGMFGVNDIITESDIRTRLTPSPAEDEVISAAIGVARGITGMGNAEILALVSSPAKSLSGNIKTRVSSRLIVDRPRLQTFQTVSELGTPQVDLLLDTPLQKTITLEVLAGTTTLSKQETSVQFPTRTQVRYEQRLDLLPGEYRLLFTIDGRSSIYPLTVAEPARSSLSQILIGDAIAQTRSDTPFYFGGMRIEPAELGNTAIVQTDVPGKLTWRLRQGISVLWSKNASTNGLAIQDLGEAKLAPGKYLLETSFGNETKRQSVQIGEKSEAGQILSQNVNLSMTERYRLLARQYLLRGKLDDARSMLNQAWQKDPNDLIQIDLSRIDVLSGRLDIARDTLTQVLARNSQSFEALTTLAYVEAQLQDYSVAANLYRQALTIQRSPVIEQALASLPAH